MPEPSASRKAGKSELLKLLRIDRRDEPVRARKPMLIILAAVALLVLVMTLWFALARGKVFEVQTAIVQSLAATQGDASVLDASGYVTARRQATVSSKVTGRVAEVLMPPLTHTMPPSLGPPLPSASPAIPPHAANC